ncbi:FAD binding domain-containing protein [Paraflavisolibacter sp. H34]|uniref:FAD binding domain-containing protein n=1 Tax=Huijunlia imazamoxiresistens TaxID=3127457 RepID=UPI00301754D3
MIRFILNNTEQVTSLPPGSLLVDYLRYHRHLTGTKIGCREGDCGACTVLVGELKEGELVYRSFVSCLTPLANVQGRHVLTIEGINGTALSPVQQAMVDEAATQCGFCTPGFVVSLTGFCLGGKEATSENALAAIDGNICRCTGYKSIERAARKVAQAMEGRGGADPVTFAVKKGVVPHYIAGIKERLQQLSLAADGQLAGGEKPQPFVGGGTDLLVQRPDELKDSANRYLFQNGGKRIVQEGDRCVLDGNVTVTDLAESELFRRHFPRLDRYIKLVSSTPIRNMATVGGNFINASPIGDFTIFFLALDARLLLGDGDNRRELPLRQLYKGYKQLDRLPGEYIEKISFRLPDSHTHFHFEKVSKRTHLDIASVNSAISLRRNNDSITEAHLSAGGVAPIPLYLEKTSTFLHGKKISEQLVDEAVELAQAEVSPISDARGSEQYKRLLLGQLIRAHFVSLVEAEMSRSDA